ncbi:hypothetical protein [Spirosoma montaniterrae]|uniref:Uncharacterized protein n=1 Tax=Spirosoma montaniterrae TaxID=1178516 RepID=A0A1P9X1W8_9BACT|nr:hypothetical protein [Spirosoma montaniterrae]AQG81617.1 hypothetical protein AWR27_21280 [Spirosoma montaniterrae]
MRIRRIDEQKRIQEQYQARIRYESEKREAARKQEEQERVAAEERRKQDQYRQAQLNLAAQQVEINREAEAARQREAAEQRRREQEAEERERKRQAEIQRKQMLEASIQQQLQNATVAHQQVLTVGEVNRQQVVGGIGALGQQLAEQSSQEREHRQQSGSGWQPTDARVLGNAGYTDLEEMSGRTGSAPHPSVTAPPARVGAGANTTQTRPWPTPGISATTPKDEFVATGPGRFYVWGISGAGYGLWLQQDGRRVLLYTLTHPIAAFIPAAGQSFYLTQGNAVYGGRAGQPLQVLAQVAAPIDGLAVGPDGSLFISTPEGVVRQRNGQTIVLSGPDRHGPLRLNNKQLEVFLSAEKRSVSVVIP